jgi:hypothetical protein
MRGWMGACVCREGKYGNETESKDNAIRETALFSACAHFPLVCVRARMCVCEACVCMHVCREVSSEEPAACRHCHGQAERAHSRHRASVSGLLCVCVCVWGGGYR